MVGNPAHNASLGSVVTLGVLPFSHIYGMVCIMISAIVNGGTVVTLPKFDPATFLDALSRYKVAYANLVPPLVNFLARHPLVDGVDLSSLKIVFSGAAPLDAVTQAQLVKRLPGVSSRQGYGMTEASPVTHIPFCA